MKRIRVDFNRRGRKGHLLSSTSRASGSIAVGDTVETYQPGEDDIGPTATVESIDDLGRVELAVDWSRAKKIRIPIKVRLRYLWFIIAGR